MRIRLAVSIGASVAIVSALVALNATDTTAQNQAAPLHVRSIQGSHGADSWAASLGADPLCGQFIKETPDSFTHELRRLRQ